MAVPTFQDMMLPLLRHAAAGGDCSAAEAVDALAAEFRLTPEELAELLPSGKQRRFLNRVGWARTYLSKAGLLEAAGARRFRITERGREVVVSRPATVNVAFLERYPEFLAFTQRAAAGSVEAPGGTVVSRPPDGQTPEESLHTAYQQLRAQLATDLLERTKQCSPAFFERLVVDLLVAMGYGGSRADAGRALGGSHDGGIDGIIKQDRLGLDAVYIQAKRWGERTVERPDVQTFVGSLAGHGASKGVFVTTSQFSPNARRYVERVAAKVVLIDGEELAQLMIDHGVGVGVGSTYVVKRVDSDYFNEA